MSRFAPALLVCLLACTSSTRADDAFPPLDQRLGRTLEPGHGVRGGSWQRTVGRKNVKRYFANNVNQKMSFKRNFPTSCSHLLGA